MAKRLGWIRFSAEILHGAICSSSWRSDYCFEYCGASYDGGFYRYNTTKLLNDIRGGVQRARLATALNINNGTVVNFFEEPKTDSYILHIEADWIPEVAEAADLPMLDFNTITGQLSCKWANKPNSNDSTQQPKELSQIEQTKQFIETSISQYMAGFINKGMTTNTVDTVKAGIKAILKQYKLDNYEIGCKEDPTNGKLDVKIINLSTNQDDIDTFKVLNELTSESQGLSFYNSIPVVTTTKPPKKDTKDKSGAFTKEDIQKAADTIKIDFGEPTNQIFYGSKKTTDVFMKDPEALVVESKKSIPSTTAPTQEEIDDPSCWRVATWEDMKAGVYTKDKPSGSSTIFRITSVEGDMAQVESGGWWIPKNCKAGEILIYIGKQKPKIEVEISGPEWKLVEDISEFKIGLWYKIRNGATICHIKEIDTSTKYFIVDIYEQGNMAKTPWTLHLDDFTALNNIEAKLVYKMVESQDKSKEKDKPANNRIFLI